MRMLVMENDKVRIALLLDKGTEIVEYVYKPLDLDFMWLSENGVQHPNAYLATSTDADANFIDYYAGGWQEVFPNGGPASSYLGARFGQHGEVAHMPWDYEIVEDHPEHIAVRLRVRTKKVPFELEKTLSLRLGSPQLHILERVRNLSPMPLQYMWGHHLAYGSPFLEEGCRICLPEGIRIVPDELQGEGFARIKRQEQAYWPIVEGTDGKRVDLSILPPRGTASDVIYLAGFAEEGWYTVENKRLGAGFEVRWDAAVMPYLWYWQEFGSTRRYPWYGRHYNIGLEPFAGYPTAGLAEAVANSTAGHIAAGAEQSFWLRVSPYCCAEESAE